MALGGATSVGLTGAATGVGATGGFVAGAATVGSALGGISSTLWLYGTTGAYRGAHGVAAYEGGRALIDELLGFKNATSPELVPPEFSDQAQDLRSRLFRDKIPEYTLNSAVGKVGYGQTELSRAAQARRIDDASNPSLGTPGERRKIATSGNYAAARLANGEVITARSDMEFHAEEKLVKEANGIEITDLYSEREPCEDTCQELTKGIKNVTCQRERKRCCARFTWSKFL